MEGAVRRLLLAARLLARAHVESLVRAARGAGVAARRVRLCACHHLTQRRGRAARSGGRHAVRRGRGVRARRRRCRCGAATHLLVFPASLLILFPPLLRAPQAVCSFGKTLVAVHPGGLQSFSPAPGGALASTGLVRFPRPAPFYTLLSACGGYAASLAPPPHEHTFGLFVTPTRAPAPHRLRPLTAGTPLFYAFSPAEDLIAAFVGAEELRLLPFSAEGLSPPPGAPAPAVFRWPLFRGGDGPAGVRNASFTSPMCDDGFS